MLQIASEIYLSTLGAIFGVFSASLFAIMLYLFQKLPWKFVLQIGIPLFVTVILTFISSITLGFAVKSKTHEMMVLSLIIESFSFVLLICSILMSLIVAVYNFMRLSILDDFDNFNFYQNLEGRNKETVPDYIFTLLLAVFTHSLIAMGNLIAIVVLIREIYPKNFENFTKFLYQEGVFHSTTS